MSWKVQNRKVESEKLHAMITHNDLWQQAKSRGMFSFFRVKREVTERHDDVQVWYDCAWSVPPEKCARINN